MTETAMSGEQGRPDDEGTLQGDFSLPAGFTQSLLTPVADQVTQALAPLREQLRTMMPDYWPLIRSTLPPQLQRFAEETKAALRQSLGSPFDPSPTGVQRKGLHRGRLAAGTWMPEEVLTMSVAERGSRGRGADSEAADADPGDGREETESERMDRNWGEILQELRATQTGTQILSGFLLTVAFQQQFHELDPAQHAIYLVLVMIAAVTTIVGLAPVNLHRALFREHLKPRIVHLGHLALRLQLLGVGLIVTGTVLLIFYVVAGLGPGLVAASGTAIVVSLAALLPRMRGRWQ